MPDSVPGYFGNSYTWDSEKKNVSTWISIGFINTKTGACWSGDTKKMENPNITKYVWRISKEAQADIPLIDCIVIMISMGDSKNFTDVMNSKVEASDMKIYYDGKLLIHEPFKRLVTEVKGAVPTEFKLEQNYPNPFNPTTKIAFSIPKAGNYTLKVYDILGQEVRTLVHGELAPGNHEFDFNGSNLPSGMYIYRLQGQNINLVKKMMLIK